MAQGRYLNPIICQLFLGEAWVIELLIGHPDQIHCELEVRTHIFVKLVNKLHEFEHKDSRFISLEEQLSIFLYMSVTGLTIQHTGEQFQRSNDMISW